MTDHPPIGAEPNVWPPRSAALGGMQAGDAANVGQHPNDGRNRAAVAAAPQTWSPVVELPSSSGQAVVQTAATDVRSTDASFAVVIAALALVILLISFAVWEGPVADPASTQIILSLVAGVQP